MSHIPQPHCYINTEDVVLFHNFPAACILASGLFSGPFALALCMEECDNASQLWLSPAAGRLGLWLPNTCLALTLLRSGPPRDLRDLRTPHTAHSLERSPLQHHTSSTLNDICVTEHLWPNVKGLDERRVCLWGGVYDGMSVRLQCSGFQAGHIKWDLYEEDLLACSLESTILRGLWRCYCRTKLKYTMALHTVKNKSVK